MESMQIIYILCATVFISLLSLTGGFLLFGHRVGINFANRYVVSFAAGVMLSAAFLDLIPEAIEVGNVMGVMTFILMGLVSFFFMERFLLWHHHHDECHHSKPTSFLVLIGDGLHNFVDGVAIASAFMADFSLGVSATLAIALHEIPQEIADFGVLMDSGMKKSKALLYNFYSSLSSVAGGLIGYLFLNSYKNYEYMLLGFGAGMFIYIACSDLIPEMHKDSHKFDGWLQSIPFVLGIFLILILGSFVHE